MELRKIRANEIQLLQDFLYEAIFIPEGVEPPAREIIELPELKLYYESFGTGTADNCIVADDDGKVIGAVWTRIMNDYPKSISRQIILDSMKNMAVSLKRRCTT